LHLYHQGTNAEEQIEEVAGGKDEQTPLFNSMPGSSPWDFGLNGSQDGMHC
jgi:hypothetical protein